VFGGEEGEAADGHEAVDDEGADEGGGGVVVPGEEEVVGVAPGDVAGAEGYGAGAAVAGDAPGLGVGPPNTGEDFCRQQQGEGPDGSAELWCELGCPAGCGVVGWESGAQDVGGDGDE
jgi:hypothetical protein